MYALIPEALDDVLSELGLKLGAVTDKEVWATCPEHFNRLGREDRKPTNFSVNRDTGKAYCFSCGYRDDLTSMVARILKVDAWAAGEWLRARGASLIDAIERVERKVDRQSAILSPSVSADVEFAVFDDPPPSRLDLRDISPESAAYYRIRWDGGWILPFTEPDGTVVGWQVKRKDGVRNHPKGLKKSRYLFGIDRFASEEHTKGAVLVESPLDVARLHTAGIYGGLASFGVEVSHEQMTSLITYADYVILALDNDDIGRRKTNELLDRYGRRIRMSLFHYGSSKAKDPGEMTDSELETGLQNARSSFLIPRRR